MWLFSKCCRTCFVRQLIAYSENLTVFGMNFGQFLVLMAIVSTAAFRPVPLRQGVKLPLVTSVCLSAPDSDANASPEGGTPENETEDVLESEVMETSDTEEESEEASEEASEEGDESESRRRRAREESLEKAIIERKRIGKRASRYRGSTNGETAYNEDERQAGGGKTGFFMVQPK